MIEGSVMMAPNYYQDDEDDRVLQRNSDGKFELVPIEGLVGIGSLKGTLKYYMILQVQSCKNEIKLIVNL